MLNWQPPGAFSGHRILPHECPRLSVTVQFRLSAYWSAASMLLSGWRGRIKLHLLCSPGKLASTDDPAGVARLPRPSGG